MKDQSMDHDSALYRSGLERSNCCANAPAKLSLGYATFAALMTLPLMTANAEQMTAIVRTPHGTPADKATVVMADTPSTLSIANCEIVKTNGVIFRRQTDSAGRVDLTPHDGDSVLVVVHPSGFAKVNCHPNTVPESIGLAPWVRIEGTCRVARKPVSNRSVQLKGALRRPPWVWSNGSARTDANGRFVIEGLMAGQAWLSESVEDFGEKERTEPVSSASVFMILIAGQTRHVDFGATGRPVIGQLRRPADSKESAPWSSAIISITPDVTKFVEGTIAFTGRADRDGNFSINDVPTGRYRLQVRFSKITREQLVNYRFSVPEIDEKLSQRPVDLGVLTLTSDARVRARNLNMKAR
jgi:hypothetical protein